MSICGLDFGTSNTTLGTIVGGEPVLTALEAGQTTIPSSIFYEVDGAVLIGRRAIEDFTGETFPSPRSDKRLAELEFARLLAGRLFPSSTRPKINTMLRHFHDRRRGKPRGARPPRQGRQL